MPASPIVKVTLKRGLEKPVSPHQSGSNFSFSFSHPSHLSFVKVVFHKVTLETMVVTTMVGTTMVAVTLMGEILVAAIWTLGAISDHFNIFDQVDPCIDQSLSVLSVNKYVFLELSGKR